MCDALPTTTSLPPIEVPYLLATPTLPFYLDESGKRYLDPLWVKDLQGHVKYIEHLVLAAPLRRGPPPEEYVCLDHLADLAGVCYVDLPAPDSMYQAFLSLPATLASLWRVTQQVEVVHSGLAGWPFPYAWLLLPIVLLQDKFFFINVESAPWRLTSNRSHSWQEKLRAWLYESAGRWCMKRADLATFTQSEYRQSLLTGHSQQGYVMHASWIDAAQVLSETVALETWQEKQRSPQLRLLFAGRLVQSKGILVLLEAMHQLQATTSVQLDILGQGDLFSVCQQASEAIAPPHSIRLLGTVPYGDDFFALLRNYHALVVPNLSDEQPRIVYDAWSQAIPVLASDTAGLRDCIQDGQTGKLLPVGDSHALAVEIQRAASEIAALQTMGMTALGYARGFTHEEMHYQRWQILVQELAAYKSRKKHKLGLVRNLVASLQAKRPI